MIIKMAGADEAEILIYDGIGKDWWGDGVTAKQFVEDLRALGNPRTLSVRINSGGGDVFDGIAIHGALARHPARKVVHVDGIAASAASLIAMAGDEIRMGAGTFVMIHNPATLAMGDSREMRRVADVLESVANQMGEIYSARTGQPSVTLRAWMDAETWMDPDQAVANGFADGVDDETIKMAASLDLNRFRNVPSTLRVESKRSRPGPRLAAMQAKVAARK